MLKNKFFLFNSIIDSFQTHLLSITCWQHNLWQAAYVHDVLCSHIHKDSVRSPHIFYEHSYHMLMYPKFVFSIRIFFCMEKNSYLWRLNNKKEKNKILKFFILIKEKRFFFSNIYLKCFWWRYQKHDLNVRIVNIKAYKLLSSTICTNQSMQHFFICFVSSMIASTIEEDWFTLCLHWNIYNDSPIKANDI